VVEKIKQIICAYQPNKYTLRYLKPLTRRERNALDRLFGDIMGEVKGERPMKKLVDILRSTAEALEQHELKLEDKSIRVWQPQDVPEWIKPHIKSWDDIDWIAFVPDSIRDTYIPWMEEGTEFGCCSVREYEVGCGYVAVGHHA